MSEIKDGGPAFPDPGRAQSAKQRETLTETGMTLRDYFAAHSGVTWSDAINVVTKHGKTSASADEVIEMFAHMRFEVADAMLRARGAA